MVESGKGGKKIKTFNRSMDASCKTMLAMVAEAIAYTEFSLSSFLYLENSVFNELLVRFIHLFPPSAVITDTILDEANGEEAIRQFDELSSSLARINSVATTVGSIGSDISRQQGLKTEIQLQGLLNLLNNSPDFNGAPQLMKVLNDLSPEYAANLVYFVLLNLAVASLPLEELERQSEMDAAVEEAGGTEIVVSISRMAKDLSDRALFETPVIQAAVAVLESRFWIDYDDFNGESIWSQ
jgi:hypothetical protein